MIYALDSNIVTYFLKNDPDVKAEILQVTAKGHEYAIPSIVYYEVKRWLILKRHKAQLREFEKFYKSAQKSDFSGEIWEKALEIYTDLGNMGKLIGDFDILIAAFCLVNGYTLVTNNARHFENIDEIQRTNWKK